MLVALATSSALPSLEPYDRPLLSALTDLGVDARATVWSDPTVDWTAPSAVVIRSTWDSHLRPEPFLAWVDAVAGATRLFNPAELIRWNMHKGYLRELAARGVPVTPTRWVARGERVDLAAAFDAIGEDALVLKPAVSANAVETHIFSRPQLAEAQRAADRLANAHDLLIQPYLRAFETEGERSYIFFDGAFSHVARRPPTLASAPRGFERAQLHAPDARELDLARATIEATGARPLYARADIATDNEGRPRLQELELTEPCLFLSLDEGAPGRLARAIVARL